MQSNSKNVPPTDLRLAMHVTPGVTFEWSQVLLAKASFNGTLKLLTAAWERVLGYGREELAGKTLGKLMRSGRTAAVVAAILDQHDTAPVDLTLRCRGGVAKRFRLHRRVDDYLREVFIVAEETHSAIENEAQPANDGVAQTSERSNHPPVR